MSLPANSIMAALRPDTLSIRTRLSLYVSAFVLLLLAVVAASGWALLDMERSTRTIDKTLLGETRLLGELSDNISEFRLAEIFLARAATEAAQASARVELAKHRATIEDVIRHIRALRARRDDDARLSRFQQRWNDYSRAHDLWATLQLAPGLLEADSQNGPMHSLYLQVEAAVDALADQARTSADREAALATKLARGAIHSMAVIAAGAILFAGAIVLRTRRRIFQPLHEVTEALAQLTAGNRDIAAPEAQSHDEIGKLVEAFNAFRANVLDLEQAHRAARFAQAQAEAIAGQDALTGLANRRVVLSRLRALTRRAGESRADCALFIIDLDRFKPVNDLLGHAVGDLVLCEIARRLESAARKGDVVARLGGDEFAVIAALAPGEDAETMSSLADRLQQALRAPIAWGEAKIEIDSSIGVASTLNIEADAGGLLRAADIAMYRAKREGKNGVCLFHPDMEAELVDSAHVEEALRRAIVNGGVKPAYQPLVDLRDGRIIGFEILSRWRDPQFGDMPPDMFIPVAERLGLIQLLTSHVLRQACRDAAGWPTPAQLSLNISALQLKNPNFVEDLLADLARNQFPPSRLEIEITETALIGDIGGARRALDAIRAQGVKVSLDDFGAGYSSLTHLREFRLDRVKIDKSFVQSIEGDSRNRRIVRSMLGLVRSLGLSTLVEGVEDEATVHFLRDAGCNYGQGYYFGRPTDAEGARALLAAAALKPAAPAAA
jgi:diguanylate cyclase (GGDEF)-like protein